MDFLNLKDNYTPTKTSSPKINDISKNTTKSNTISRIIPLALPLIFVPTFAHAGLFDSLHGEFLKIADILALAVFSFSGVAWMFGHRSKGIEMLFGGLLGYIIVRHAVDIRDYVKAWTMRGGF